MTVRSYDCADAPLHVININIHYAVIRSNILVRAHKLRQLTVSMIKAAGDAAVLFRPADLTVTQVIGDHRFSSLPVSDFREVSGSVIEKLRTVLDTTLFLRMFFQNQAVCRIILPADFPALRQTDARAVAILIVFITGAARFLYSLRSLLRDNSLYQPPALVIAVATNQEQSVVDKPYAVATFVIYMYADSLYKKLWLNLTILYSFN